MNEHDSRKPPPKVSNDALLLLSAVILSVGIASAWLFHRAQQAPVAHAESASFRQLDAERVLLADTFRSQDSEAAITTPLRAAGLNLSRTVLQRPDNPRHPPWAMVSVTVSGYRHLDNEGTLVLEFFNDRLMEVDFRPDDAARYAPRLRRAVPGLRGIGTGHAELVAGPLRVWSSVELARSAVGRSLGSEGLVLWQDLRLIRQRDDWDARFGHIPIAKAE